MKNSRVVSRIIYLHYLKILKNLAISAVICTCVDSENAIGSITNTGLGVHFNITIDFFPTIAVHASFYSQPPISYIIPTSSICLLYSYTQLVHISYICHSKVFCMISFLLHLLIHFKVFIKISIQLHTTSLTLDPKRLFREDSRLAPIWQLNHIVPTAVICVFVRSTHSQNRLYLLVLRDLQTSA